MIGDAAKTSALHATVRSGSREEPPRRHLGWRGGKGASSAIPSASSGGTIPRSDSYAGIDVSAAPAGEEKQPRRRQPQGGVLRCWWRFQTLQTRQGRGGGVVSSLNCSAVVRLGGVSPLPTRFACLRSLPPDTGMAQTHCGRQSGSRGVVEGLQFWGKLVCVCVGLSVPTARARCRPHAPPASCSSRSIAYTTSSRSSAAAAICVPEPHT